MNSSTLNFEGTLVSSQEKGYVYLPFDVPANASRIEVAYAYSHQIDSDPLLKGGNTIDIGLFDSRGIEFLSAGFRGWSGSERASFFITPTEATPGYLAGELRAGQWNVLLGLYKIAPEGCHYRVTVSVTSENMPSPLALQERGQGERSLPASPVKHRSGRWLRGEMHCHTLHSDGEYEPIQVVQLARERGLDFLAITDHNSLSCQHELENLDDPGLILIRGIEVTTFKGHFNVWGIPDWVDFRVMSAKDMQAAIDFAVERGGLVSCNHPKPFGPPWDYPEVEGMHCIEVWNGPWDANNWHAEAFWNEKLKQGKHFVAVGGSDWHDHQHTPRNLGTPTLWVYVPESPSAQAILDAIGHGHVALSAEPDGALLEFSLCPLQDEIDGALYDLCVEPERAVRGGDSIKRAAQSLVLLRCHNAAGQMLFVFDQNHTLHRQRIEGDDQTVTLAQYTGESMYVRAELRDEQGALKALTNPIYLV